MIPAQADVLKSTKSLKKGLTTGLVRFLPNLETTGLRRGLARPAPAFSIAIHSPDRASLRFRFTSAGVDGTVEWSRARALRRAGFPAMDDATIKQAVDDLANALQTAVLVAAKLQVRVSEDAEELASLNRALRRATSTLQGPPTTLKPSSE